MAEKRENSVLFSLRELRQIEEDRVKSEEQAVRQREEDERARMVAEQRRVRDEEERRRREAMDLERARLDAEEARRREESLRLEETERRARVEADARLEEQKLRMEIEARAKEASSKKARFLVAITAIAIIIVGVTGVFAYKAFKDREAAAAAAALQQKINEDNVRKNEDLQQKMQAAVGSIASADDEIKKTIEDINKSKDAEERKRLNDRIQEIQRQKYEAAERLRKLSEERSKLPVAHSKKCENSTDPLCQ
jgi:colicin import membrane protein